MNQSLVVSRQFDSKNQIFFPFDKKHSVEDPGSLHFNSAFQENSLCDVVNIHAEVNKVCFLDGDYVTEHCKVSPGFVKVSRMNCDWFS